MGFKVTEERITVNNRESVYLEDGTCDTTEVYQTIEHRTETPVDESVYVDIAFDLYKARDDEQLVSGWANVAVNADGSIPLDWDGDVIQPATLEKAAINFMLDYRGSGVMHEGNSTGTVVESIVFTKEKQEALGIPDGIVPQGWFITVKVHDAEVFAKVKDGTYKMFSIQGKSKRVPIG